MSFEARWHELLERTTEVPSEATFLTPLSRRPFGVADVRDRCIVVEYRDGDDTDRLRREQFETLSGRVRDARDGFAFDRLPPNAEPYAAVLSLLPGIAVDDEDGVLRATASHSGSPLVRSPEGRDGEASPEEADPASTTQPVSESDPTIAEMLENMGDPGDRVVCPIEGCRYSHRSAASVARHVSGSASDKHIWENTGFDGWRDFVQRRG